MAVRNSLAALEQLGHKVKGEEGILTKILDDEDIAIPSEYPWSIWVSDPIAVSKQC